MSIGAVWFGAPAGHAGGVGSRPVAPANSLPSPVGPGHWSAIVRYDIGSRMRRKLELVQTYPCRENYPIRECESGVLIG
jgi:hypothetical protein